MESIDKVGLPVHDAAVEALVEAPTRGAASDGLPVWASTVLVLIAVFCVLVNTGVIL